MTTERLLLEGHSHHLMRKSPARQLVFHDAADYAHCIAEIRDRSEEYGIRVHAWCLLPDRMHLLATPTGNPANLSMFMKVLTHQATLRWKKRHDLPCPWEPRYRSSPVEPGPWLMACMYFIEHLPVRFGLARAPFHYCRSSYRMRLGRTLLNWLSDPDEYHHLGATQQARIAAYRAHMRTGLDTREIIMIESALMRGRLTGSPHFVQEVEENYDMQGINRGPGRPRKPT